MFEKSKYIVSSSLMISGAVLCGLSLNALATAYSAPSSFVSLITTFLVVGGLMSVGGIVLTFVFLLRRDK